MCFLFCHACQTSLPLLLLIRSCAFVLLCYVIVCPAVFICQVVPCGFSITLMHSNVLCAGVYYGTVPRTMLRLRTGYQLEAEFFCVCTSVHTKAYIIRKFSRDQMAVGFVTQHHSAGSAFSGFM